MTINKLLALIASAEDKLLDIQQTMRGMKVGNFVKAHNLLGRMENRLNGLYKTFDKLEGGKI